LRLAQRPTAVEGSLHSSIALGGFKEFSHLLSPLRGYPSIRCCDYPPLAPFGFAQGRLWAAIFRSFGAAGFTLCDGLRIVTSAGLLSVGFCATALRPVVLGRLDSRGRLSLHNPLLHLRVPGEELSKGKLPITVQIFNFTAWQKPAELPLGLDGRMCPFHTSDPKINVEGSGQECPLHTSQSPHQHRRCKREEGSLPSLRSGSNDNDVGETRSVCPGAFVT
jgi:hypothetical protein